MAHSLVVQGGGRFGVVGHLPSEEDQAQRVDDPDHTSRCCQDGQTALDRPRDSGTERLLGDGGGLPGDEGDEEAQEGPSSCPVELFDSSVHRFSSRYGGRSLQVEVCNLHYSFRVVKVSFPAR